MLYNIALVAHHFAHFQIYLNAVRIRTAADNILDSTVLLKRHENLSTWEIYGEIPLGTEERENFHLGKENDHCLCDRYASFRNLYGYAAFESLRGIPWR